MGAYANESVGESSSGGSAVIERGRRGGRGRGSVENGVESRFETREYMAVLNDLIEEIVVAISIGEEDVTAADGER